MRSIDYTFCFDKKGKDGYKIDNKMTLNNKIKLFNFKKDLIYEGFDENRLSINLKTLLACLDKIDTPVFFVSY